MDKTEQGKPDGYYVPFHKSLIMPVLTGGIDRNLCFGLWSIGIAVGIMLQMYWFLIVVTIVHLILRKLTARDNAFFSVLVNHIHDKKLFEI